MSSSCVCSSASGLFCSELPALHEFPFLRKLLKTTSTLKDGYGNGRSQSSRLTSPFYLKKHSNVHLCSWIKGSSAHNRILQYVFFFFFTTAFGLLQDQFFFFPPVPKAVGLSPFDVTCRKSVLGDVLLWVGAGAAGREVVKPELRSHPLNCLPASEHQLLSGGM